MVFTFCVYVYNFEEVECMYIKVFPLSAWLAAKKMNFKASQWGVLLLKDIFVGKMSVIFVNLKNVPE